MDPLSRFLNSKALNSFLILLFLVYLCPIHEQILFFLIQVHTENLTSCHTAAPVQATIIPFLDFSGNLLSGLPEYILLCQFISNTAVLMKLYICSKQCIGSPSPFKGPVKFLTMADKLEHNFTCPPPVLFAMAHTAPCCFANTAGIVHAVFAVSLSYLFPFWGAP